MALGLAVCARTGWRLHESVELTRLGTPKQRPLAQHFPGLEIDNRAQDGATLSELMAQYRFREPADAPFFRQQELNATE